MVVMPDIPDLIERLAELEHTQWAAWTKYMLDNLTDENVARWKLLIDTPYIEVLNKDSDREWAVRVVAELHKHMEGERIQLQHHVSYPPPEDLMEILTGRTGKSSGDVM